jgi:hypothetical protein
MVCERSFARPCEELSRPRNPVLACRPGLLRGACHRARVRATRWLAMTGRTDIMPPANPIERSFELAAERCEDLPPLVYRRLFNEHPEAQAMFRSEGSDPVKGSMLALTIEAILDFAGDRRGHFRLIACEGVLARCLWQAARSVRRILRRHRGDVARVARFRLVTRDRHGMATVAGADRGRGRGTEPQRRIIAALRQRQKDSAHCAID